MNDNFDLAAMRRMATLITPFAGQAILQCCDEIERRQARASLAQPASVPAGWKLVPVEPTDDMLANVDEEVGGHCHSCTKWNASWSDCRRVYAAMLAAAPQAPQPAQADGDWVRADDVQRLTRELDVALNGEAGAARQASLCDLVAQVKRRAAPQPAQATPSYRRDYPTSEKVLGVEHEKARDDERLYGVGFTVNGWHVPAPVVACWGMENKRENERRYAAFVGQAPQPEAQPQLTAAARERIGQWLASDMAIAVRNGANSVSMPDELVEIAAWLCDAPSAQPHRGEFKTLDPDIAKFISDNLWELAAPSAQAEPKKPDRTGMTYYKNNACLAASADSPDCICWTKTVAEQGGK